jgi:hypothetical protein
MTQKETNNYSNFVILQIGDSSGDGHEKTSNYYYKNNKDTDAWDKARDKGIKLFGWTLDDPEIKHEHFYPRVIEIGGYWFA